ncbi:MAG: hypothetical protein DMG62_18645 [Acidobacteria bacterium]|nr:MAG: hypothetical protein DMG62_18645 [Acidobacteriota bacterium]
MRAESVPDSEKLLHSSQVGAQFRVGEPAVKYPPKDVPEILPRICELLRLWTHRDLAKEMRTTVS